MIEIFEPKYLTMEVYISEKKYIQEREKHEPVLIRFSRGEYKGKVYRLVNEALKKWNTFETITIGSGHGTTMCRKVPMNLLEFVGMYAPQNGVIVGGKE